MSAESSAGISLGNLIAALLSWAKWHSIGYAIVHAICSWFYVLWYIAKYLT